MAWLVRHACAGSKADWRGDDGDRPLDRVGRLQAVEIAELLARRNVDSLLASPTRRCRDTLSHLALALELPIKDAHWLGVDSTGEAALSRLTKPESSSLVACTHGEVMGRVIDVLRTRDWVIDGGNDDGAMRKGVIWRLDPNERVVQIHSDGVEDCEEHGATWW